MQVPLFDIEPAHKPIASALCQAVNNVITSGRFILGQEVERLEASLAEYCGSRYVIGVSSGTDALLIALMALGIREGDLVLVPSFSFFATAGVVARVGARPIFVDIDPNSFNISGETLQAAWEKLSLQEKSEVRAIISVHLYGQCADMDTIRAFAEPKQLPIVEDAAQAIGTEYEMASLHGVHKAGDLGVMGCFSFYPTKNLGAAGDAGCVSTSSQPLAEMLLKLRNHGATQAYYHYEVGGNFRIDAMQAAVLNVKLPYLAEWNATRQRNAALYDKLIDSMNLQKHVKRPIRCNTSLKDGHTFHQYVIRATDRDALKVFLKESGIGTAIYYPLPLHLQPCFANLHYKSGSLPVCERAANEVLALPIYPGLTEEQQIYVVERMAAFYRKG